jgi:hypothetical protein
VTGRTLNHDSGIQPGERYRRDRGDNVEECATVVALGSDALGIPHVRFMHCLTLPSGRTVENERALALRSFVGMYRELVA